MIQCKSIFAILLLLAVSKIGATDQTPFSLVAIPGQTVETQVDDQSIVSRLVASYRQIAKKKPVLGKSVWQGYFDTCHVSVHNTFLEGTLSDATNILRYPHKSELFYGFDIMADVNQQCFSTSEQQNGHAINYLMSLEQFAEFIGAISLSDLELQSGDSDFPWQADAIIEKINQALGIQLTFPNPYPHEHGALSSSGVISYRATQALYQAYRIKQLVSGIENPRVLEIGAGLGRTAYYARMLGIKDYTIVDIPITSMASGYFLGRTLGEDKILLPGETAPDAQDRVKILTPMEFVTSNETYDLIVNVDGFTEYDPYVARTYLRHIENVTPLFLSINHEQNLFTVKQLLDESGRIAERTREQYLMRDGYFEETARFKQ
jgi:hypothetical protein